MIWVRRLLLVVLVVLAGAPLLIVMTAAGQPAAACDPLLPPPLGCIPGQPPPQQCPCFPPTLPPPPPCVTAPTAPGVPPPTCPPSDPAPPAPGAPGEPAAPEAGSGSGTGAVSALFGDDGTGLGGYDIGYDEGGTFDIDRSFWGLLTQMVWAGVTGLMSFCTWLIDWVFQFTIVDYLTDPVTEVASWWREEIVDRLGLPAFLLMLAIAVAGFHLLRGRTQHGIREGLVSSAIAAISAIVLLDPVGYLLGDDGLLGQTEQTAIEVAQITLGEDPVAGDDGASVAEPINEALVDGFVAKPHQVINWGGLLEDQGACLAVSQDMVASGPHGADDEPRDAMADAGCQAEFDFNQTPSADRLLGAFLVLIAALVMTALIVLVGFSVVAVQVGFAVMACLAVFAIPAGILPGPGRAIMWQWATFAMKLLAALLAAVVFLALMLVLIQGLLSAGNDDSLMGRLAALDALVICGFVFRKRLFAAAERGAVRISGKAAAATAGVGAAAGAGMGAGAMLGSGGSARTAGGANSAGALWRENAAEIRRTAAPMQALGHNVAETGRGAQRVIRPAAEGTTRAQQLHTELSRSRVGRGALHGAKAAQVTGKAGRTATAWTLGAPVTLPRASRKAAESSKVAAQQLKGQLSARAGKVANYGREWGHNVAAPVTAASRSIDGVRQAARATTHPPRPPGAGAGPGTGPAPARGGPSASPLPGTPAAPRTWTAPAPAPRPPSGSGAARTPGSSPAPAQRGTARTREDRPSVSVRAARLRAQVTPATAPPQRPPMNGRR